MIELGSRVAERVTFAVGADPDRVSWAIDLARKAAADAGRDSAELSFGAYRHGRLPSRRGRRSEPGRWHRRGVRPLLSYAGSTGAGLAERDRSVVAEVGRRYDSNRHLSNEADHAKGAQRRFRRSVRDRRPSRGVRGPISAVGGLGVERFVITGTGLGADRADAHTAAQLLTSELLPALREEKP